MSLLIATSNQVQLFSVQFPQNEGPFLIQSGISENKRKVHCSGIWEQNQEIKFAAFLSKFGMEIGSMGKLEKWDMFKLMSKFIKTRNFLQCKSHFTKVLQKFSSIYEFIEELKVQFEEFEVFYKECLKELSSFNISYSEITKVSTSFEISGSQLSTKMNMQNIRTAITYEVEDETSPENILNLSSLPKGLLKIFYPELLKQKDRKVCEDEILMWGVSQN